MIHAILELEIHPIYNVSCLIWRFINIRSLLSIWHAKSVWYINSNFQKAFYSVHSKPFWICYEYFIYILYIKLVSLIEPRSWFPPHRSQVHHLLPEMCSSLIPNLYGLFFRWLWNLLFYWHVKVNIFIMKTVTHFRE